jgi:hypothetical protein
MICPSKFLSKFPKKENQMITSIYGERKKAGINMIHSTPISN